MKKLLIIISIASTVQFANAQIHKGAIALGLQLGLSSSNNTQSNIYMPNTGYKSTNLKFIPEVSYFLSDKFALGLGVGYTLHSGIQNTSMNVNYSNKAYKLKDQTNMVTLIHMLNIILNSVRRLLFH